MHELLSIVSGVAVGVLFALMRLPIPAPPTIAGVLGIVGIFIGYWIMSKLNG